MISTVSFSFDLSASPPRAVITDSTNYLSIGLDVATQQAKGYGVLTFNGDIIEEFDTPSNPLIDLEAGDTVGYINLPLDNNGNVANGSYSFQYSLRLNSENFAAAIAIVTGGTTLTEYGPYTFLADFLEVGDPIRMQAFFSPTAISNTVSGITLPNVITLGTSVANNTYGISIDDITHQQFSATYAYSGCTQTTADVDFIYDCEYGNSGTWSVSNATVLGSNEIVSSLSCTINYPSWTNIDPLFTPQIVTTSLPYPTLPTEDTPLATGTYSILLAEQIQQTQTSGLVVTYNKSITKEFTVSCAGTLCGLVPCIENLRAAHAAELVRNRISKYQVFVDNVLLYYTEAMNYRACGELDKYKETIALLEAQLDASGCECACCDDETYYWVSNNSANSIIDELLANFQYRLFDGGIGDPGPTQPGVEYGAIWQNTNTGVLYRCIDPTPGNLEWIVYYDPNGTIPATRVTATPTGQLNSTTVQGQLSEVANEAVFGATNGLTKSGSNVKLGGTITELTTTIVGNNLFGYTIGNGFISMAKTGPGAALALSGVSNVFGSLASDNVAGIFAVSRDTTDNTVAKNVSIKTITGFGSEAVVGNGFGASVEFVLHNTANVEVVASSIKSSWSGAAGQNSRLDLTTATSGVESTQLSILANGDLYLDKYGDGNKTETAIYNLGVQSNGRVVESDFPVYSLIVLNVTQSSTGVTITTIINTTKDAVTGANLGVSRPGEFKLSHPAILAAKTSVLVQNGNAPGVTPRVGFVYAEAGTGVIDFKTYNNDATPDLIDGILNNAIVEIKIFP
jgi:hypothetical protein